MKTSEGVSSHLFLGSQLDEVSIRVSVAGRGAAPHHPGDGGVRERHAGQGDDEREEEDEDGVGLTVRGL